MSSINKVKLPDNSTVDINDSRIHIYRTLSGTAAQTSRPYYCSRWDITDSTISEYTDGMVVCVKVPVAGNGTYGTGLQINSLGYKPVVYNVNSMVGTRYSAGAVLWAVYNSTQTARLYLGSGGQTITGCWQVQDYGTRGGFQTSETSISDTKNGNDLTSLAIDGTANSISAGAFYCTFSDNAMNVSGSIIYDNYSAGKSVYCKVISYDEKHNAIASGFANNGNDLILHLETCMYSSAYANGYIRFSGYRYYLDYHDIQQYEYIELEGLCTSDNWAWSLHNPVLALPSIEDQNNKILSVNADANGLQWIANSGGGSLANYDFTHTADTAVAASTTVAFTANTRGSQMVSAAADLSVTFAVNNSSDNYLWIKNTGSSDIGIAIYAVTWNSNPVSNVYIPDDGISIPAGKVCEICIVCNADGAFIASRSDLSLQVKSRKPDSTGQ